ncbi:MAG: DUF4860 domain-containing protein [Lachnospiraceae bacterium]|nr:DUF4860 domain-containing protein [Lachnospiraceae bacterium]
MIRFHAEIRKRGSIVQRMVPVVLFAFFAVGAVLVILFGVRVYRSTVEKSSEDFNSGTLLTYITEKIHQSDREGSVSVEALDGRKALVLKNREAEGSYDTYIYFYQNNVCELTVPEGAAAKPEAGDKIFDAGDFEPEDLGGGLFRFRCVDVRGNTAVTYAAVRSAAGEEAQQ